MISYKESGISTERTSDEYLALNSCGIEQLDEIDRGSMRKNGRVDYHILYIARGICYLGEEMRPIGAGNVILFRPGEPQIYAFRARDKSISHYIHFTGIGCASLLERLGLDKLTVFNMGVSKSYEEISAEISREYSMKKPFWESFTAARLHSLLSLIARKHALRSEQISHLSESRIGAACRKIYENLASPPSLSALAADACLSESRFSHLFSEVVGRSPHEFILAMRIDRACDLLADTSMSVKEIAESLGYSDQNYFSRLFKARLGLSPRDWRERDGT